MTKKSYAIYVENKGLLDNLPEGRSARMAEFNTRASTLLADARNNIDAFLKTNGLTKDLDHVNDILIVPALVVECTEEVARKLEQANIPGVERIRVNETVSIELLKDGPSHG